LFNYLLDSLYILDFLFLEMQKFIGSLFFAWDKELCCPITGEIPICNSSDLNEELGQVN
jgi:phospholipid-translocating ATPase